MAFSIDSPMWDTPTVELDPCWHFDLLGDVYYHYSPPLAIVQQSPPLAPLKEEVSVEDFQPPELSEEEAI
jgi:hypothetical protein